MYNGMVIKLQLLSLYTLLCVTLTMRVEQLIVVLVVVFYRFLYMVGKFVLREM
jgi:hypothetical protein